MARTVSAAMKRAEKMVTRKRDPLSAAEAARRNGITETGIYKSRWYREFKGLPPKAKPATKEK